MSEAIQLDWACFGAQKDFLECEERNVLYLGGRGSGKTTTGARKFFKYMATYPAIRDGKPIPGARLAIIGPSYTRMRRSTVAACEREWPPGTFTLNWEDHYFRTVFGWTVELISAEHPDQVRGFSGPVIWVDEVIPEDVFRNAKMAMRQSRLAKDHFPRQFFMTTTPQGRNWIWRNWVHSPRPGYRMFRMTTHEAYSYGFVSEDDYEDFKNENVGIFGKQELDAEFVAAEGLVFPTFDPLVHQWTPEKYPPLWGSKASPSYQVVLGGVDFGSSSPSAIVIYARDRWGKRYLLDEFYRRRVSESEMVAQLQAFQKKYRVIRFAADSSDPAYIRKLRAQGLPVVAASRKDKDSRVARGLRVLEVDEKGNPGLIYDPKCVNWAREMQEWGYVPASSEFALPKDRFQDENDHAIAAWLYAEQEMDKVIAWEGASQSFKVG